MKAQPRYVPMCIPGNDDAGSDDWWCVYDMKRRRTAIVVGEGNKSAEAARLAWTANHDGIRRARKPTP